MTAASQLTPRLALNFLTASLDPSVSFSRPLNTATCVNSLGYVETINADTARFDFNPITLACNGLLIEEQRSNLTLNSSAFSGGWTLENASIASTAATAPNNAASVSKLVEDTATGPHGIYFGVAVSTATHAGSIFLKAAERTKTSVFLFNASPVAVYEVQVDLSNGTVIGTPSGTWSITPFKDGWYRVSIVSSTVLSGTARLWIRSLNAAGSTSYTGDGVSGLYVWGSQLEAGAFPTSHIPTTTAPVTRNADVATITGTNFSDFWQASKGGVLVRARPGTVSGTRPWVQFDDGTADNLIAILGNTTNPELYIVDSTTPQAQIDAGTIAANTDYAMTAWWNTDDCKARLDNGAVSSDTSATIPTVDQMRIGSDGTNYLNGHIASIGYYDRFSSQIYTRRKNKAVFSLL